MNVLHKISIMSLAAALAAGCSTQSGGGIEYRTARAGTPLEVPPDLMRLNNSNRYAVPGVGESASSANQYAQAQQQIAQANSSGVTAPSAAGDVQIKRDGNQRWLSVQRSAEQLWEPVKAFWEDNGFVLSVEDRKLGLMETDWAENRADIPNDLIRRTLGKLFDSLYSTGQLDRFRTRLEKNSEGGTDIFISQRGMEEVYTSRDKSTTSWQPRANDPALEDEFLRRLMMALGVPQDRAQAMVEQNKVTPTTPKAAAAQATIAQTGVQYDEANQALLLADGAERAWRRVGLSLDRSGFTVEDRDSARGVYHVRYVPLTPEKTKESSGWFGRMFSKKPEIKAVRYQVSLQTQGEAAVVVRVLTEAGQAAAANESAQILRVLAKDLSQL